MLRATAPSAGIASQSSASWLQATPFLPRLHGLPIQLRPAERSRLGLKPTPVRKALGRPRARPTHARNIARKLLLCFYLIKSAADSAAKQSVPRSKGRIHRFAVELPTIALRASSSRPASSRPPPAEPNAFGWRKYTANMGNSTQWGTSKAVKDQGPVNTDLGT